MESYAIPNELKQKILDCGFSIEDEGDNYVRFGKTSPAGQDFGFSVNLGEDLIDFAANIKSTYSDFDISEETYLWLDRSGHGQNGAPYDMRDCYNDMEACKEAIYELYCVIDDYLNEEENHEVAAEPLVSPDIH